MSEFTQERITAIVQGYIRETLANDEKCRAISGPTADSATTLPGMTLLESSDMKQEEAQSLLKSVNRWLKQQDHYLMEPVAEKLIKLQGDEVCADKQTHQTLSRELMKAFQGVLNVRIRRSQGDYSVPDDELIPLLKELPQAISGVSAAEPATISSVTFSEVRNYYVAEVEKGESWTEKTKAENSSIFDLFVRAVGDLPIEVIDRKILTEYKSLLMKLPPNLNKGGKYKDKSLEEIVEILN